MNVEKSLLMHLVFPRTEGGGLYGEQLHERRRTGLLMMLQLDVIRYDKRQRHPFC